MKEQIPEFNENGLLPPGKHLAGIEDIAARFGGSKSLKRSQLTKNLKSFYNFIKYYCKAIYVDGSYVTNKISPNDVDLLIIFPSDFKPNVMVHMRFMEFTVDYQKYKLHAFSFFEGKDDKKINEFFEYFTHTDPDRNPDVGRVEKGIISVECEK